MRVLYVCHEPLPSPHTNTEQIVKTAAALAEQGIETEVFCPTPSATGGGAEGAAAIARFYGVPGHVLENGLRIVEHPVPRIVRGKGVLPWHDMRAALHARRGRYDVVYTRDPFSLVMALSAHDRVVFETYRVDLNTRTAYGIWRRFCYSRPGLLGIVTHSHLAARSFLKAGFGADRVLVAHNGFSLDAMTPRLAPEDARRRLGLPSGQPLVVYTGHVDRTKGLEVLLPLAAALPDVHFLLVGHIADSDGLRDVRRGIAARGLANVTLVPRIPPSAVTPYLYAADCLLIPPSSRPLHTHRRTVLPLKTFLYLAAGRPILAPDLPDLREVLEHDRDAVLVRPDDPAVAARTLRTLLADPARRARLSSNASRTAAAYTWTARARKIALFLRNRLAAR